MITVWRQLKGGNVASAMYLRKLVERRRARGRVAGLASASARKARARASESIVRVSRVVRVSIEDSHRPGVVLTLRRDERGNGRWGRWRVDGHELAALASTGIGRLLARFLD